MVRQVLVAKGVAVVRRTEYHPHPDRFRRDVLLEHVPYQTVYGHPGRIEFPGTGDAVGACDQSSHSLGLQTVIIYML